MKDKLGPLLFEHSPSSGTAHFQAFCAFVLLSGGFAILSVIFFIPEVRQEMIWIIPLGLFLFFAFFGCVSLFAALKLYRKTWKVRWSLYERGATWRKGDQRKTILFDKVQGISYRHKLVYAQGSGVLLNGHFDLFLADNPQGEGAVELYMPNVGKMTDDDSRVVLAVADRLIARLAEEMRQRIDTQGRTAWCEDVVLEQKGIAIPMRSKTRKLAWKKVSRMEMFGGKFYLLEGENQQQALKLPTDAYNFFPGMEIIVAQTGIPVLN